jgi:hypothetical protein
MRPVLLKVGTADFALPAGRRIVISLRPKLGIFDGEQAFTDGSAKSPLQAI